MLEIYASHNRLSTGDVQLDANPTEICLRIALGRYTVPLAGATPDQLRADATMAATCAAAWHRMSSALTAEAERREAAQHTAADGAIAQAAASVAADEARPRPDETGEPTGEPSHDATGPADALAGVETAIAGVETAIADQTGGMP